MSMGGLGGVGGLSPAAAGGAVGADEHHLVGLLARVGDGVRDAKRLGGRARALRRAGAITVKAATRDAWAAWRRRATQRRALAHLTRRLVTRTARCIGSTRGPF